MPRGWVLFGAIVLIQGCADERPVPEAVGAVDGDWFRNEAAARGVFFQHESGASGRFFLPEITAGGVALIDVEGDGDLDLYFVQGGDVTGAAERPPNELYLNDGRGQFSFAEDAHGAADASFGMGVAVGDYDNDGDDDLYVTNLGANRLFRNDGNGYFEEVGDEAGVAHEGWGTGAGFVDLDGDGWLDLVHANYIVWSPRIERNCFMGDIRTYCPPQNYNAPTVDTVYRNNRDGSFTDMTDASGLTSAAGNGFGLVTRDFDNDGRPDIFVANDMMADRLWLNRGEFQFVEAGMAVGVAIDAMGAPKAGMGVATGDVDRDGDADLLVVNIDGQSDSLFLNDGDFFSDATAVFGLVADSRQFTRWGVALVDFDNDGWLDLFEANGRVDPGPSPTSDPWAEVNLLYRGGASGFRRLPLDRSRVHTSRGLAIGDLDDDGGVDLVIVNRDAPAYVLMNRVDRGQWVRFQPVSHGRTAIGAEVELVGHPGDGVWKRHAQPDGSYLAASDSRVHFGLGRADAARVDAVIVTWPDGRREAINGPFALATTHVLLRTARN